MGLLSLISGRYRDLGQFVARLAEEAASEPENKAAQLDLGTLIKAFQAGKPLDEAATDLTEWMLSTRRPRLILQDGHIEAGNTGFEASRLGKVVSAKAESISEIASSVGFVKVSNSPSFIWVGTCFLVAHNLVATARRVVELFAEPSRGGRKIRKGLEIDIEFGSTDGNSDRTFRVRDVALVHPVLDFALLRIAGRRKIGGPLRFDCGASSASAKVMTIGLQVQDATKPLLADRTPSKTASPGIFVGMGTASIGGTGQYALKHDCSTSPGMAGAPVVDLETGLVLGVHFAAERWVAGYAVPASEIARDPHIRELPLEFEHASPIDPTAWSEEWHALTGKVIRRQVEEDTPNRSAEISGIPERLFARFPKEDDLVAFLNGLGPDYAAAVAAQPGRGRSDAGYYSAVTGALQRRGLINKDFLRLIDIGSEEKQAPVTDVTKPKAARWLSVKDVTTLSKKLKDLKGPALQTIALGSPVRHELTEDGKLLPLPTILERLASDPRPQARDALKWLLARSRSGASNAQVTAAIDAALTKLGVSTTQKNWGDYAPGPEEIVDISYLTAGLEAARSVGRIMVANGGGSSCWLIAPELIIAAAHLFATIPEFDLKSGSRVLPDINNRLRVEFDFVVDGTRSSTVELLETIPFYDLDLDIVLVQTKSPILDRAPLQIRADALQQGGISIIHHPGLGPKKISALGGRMLENNGHEAIYLVATEAGSGGAPILDRSWKVVATHRAWVPHMSSIDGATINTKLGTGAPAMLEAIRTSSQGQAYWRRIAAAQRSMRSLDASLIGAEAEGTSGKSKRPIVIELLDGETALPAVAGLEILARTGPIVSAAATQEAIRTLADTQGVISIEASGAGGSSECAMSLPFIGVPAVRVDFEDERGDRALIGVIDDGIDVLHEAFRDESGKKTRILAFWDQKDPRANAEAPSWTISAAGQQLVADCNLKGGAVYVAADIDEMIKTNAAVADFPPANRMHHGTIVSSIAAGRATGMVDGTFVGGVAPAARLIVVRYDLDGDSVGNSGGHVQALAFFNSLAEIHDLPIVVNISNGMNSGAHDGTSKVEGACDFFCGYGSKPGRAVIESAGNEGGQGRHSLMSVSKGIRKTLRWSSNPKPDALNPASLPERIELWFHRQNIYRFWIVAPDGGESPKILSDMSLNELLPNGNRIDALYRQKGSNGLGMLELVISKGEAATVRDGIWKLCFDAIEVSPRSEINAWMENVSNRVMFFMDDPRNEYTLTVPGTAEHVITVGAVSLGEVPESFSKGSQGPALSHEPKPNLAAPGVGIRAARAMSGTQNADPEDGTSLAAPHVTGVVALAMSRRRKRMDADPALRMFGTKDLKFGLQDTCRNFVFEANVSTGHGIVDAVAFMNAMDAV